MSFCVLIYSSLVDDSQAVGWTQTRKEYPLVKSSIHPDNYFVGSWGLLHQAAVATHFHHDASGAGSWIQVPVGAKLWVTANLSAAHDHATRDTLTRLTLAITYFDNERQAALRRQWARDNKRRGLRYDKEDLRSVQAPDLDVRSDVPVWFGPQDSDVCMYDPDDPEACARSPPMKIPGALAQPREACLDAVDGMSDEEIAQHFNFEVLNLEPGSIL